MAKSALSKQIFKAAAPSLLSIFVVGQALANEGIRVAASIKPVHSLVSSVMEGAGEPHLLMRGAGSHHEFSLRPSGAAALEKAAVVFLVHKQMESSLARPLEILARNARVVELANAAGLVLKPLREGGAFEEDPDHHHGDNEHHAHDHGDAQDSGGARRDFDLHVWLDPVNAAAMASMIADALSEADPANAALYEENADELLSRLEVLSGEVAEMIAPVRDRPFIVFHDTYRYFEDRYGLAAAGSASVSRDRSPGVRRIRELRAKVRELGVVCVFSEPHFDQGLVATVIEGTDIRSGILDSLGVDVEDGPALYVSMMRDLAASFVDCLSPTEGG